jgi:mycofactocin precursor
VTNIEEVSRPNCEELAMTDLPESGTAVAEDVAEVAPEVLEADVLVEEVSIDGMCGVY